MAALDPRDEDTDGGKTAWYQRGNQPDIYLVKRSVAFCHAALTR